jgi:hypothetical protein
MSYTGQLVGGSILLAAYLVIVLFAACNYIRAANRGWLEAHEVALRGRIAAAGTVPGAAAAALRTLLPRATTERESRWAAMSPCAWIGFREISRWVRLHEAQRVEVVLLPEPVVRSRFARAMGQVDELPALRQVAWQRRWAELQKVGEHPDARRVARPSWRNDLSQLLAELFNARDSTYNQLVSLYGKAGWLVFAAYLPVSVLLVAGYGQVLLAGFLGGLISRMQRIVYGQGRPTAYGASWVPLFLAPLLGALAAWAGLHLLSLLQGLGIVSLDGVLPVGSDVRLHPGQSVLGIAVLLGFSERLFNQLGDHADKVLQVDRGESAAAAEAPVPAPSPVTFVPAQRRGPRRVRRGARANSVDRRRSVPRTATGAGPDSNGRR